MQLVGRFQTLVAEILGVEAVTLAAQIVAAELRKQHGSAELIGLEYIFLEVDMQALGVADILIVPAGGVIDGACWVNAHYLCRDPCRVKLPPTLVKGYPHGYAGAIIESLYHFVELGFVSGAALHVVAGKELVVSVAEVDACDEGSGDDDGVIFAAAVYHVLPDQHSQPVAVIVPAQRLDLYMLTQHIKAHILCRLNVKNHRLVARCGVHTVRPVALIEQTVVEVGLAV